MAMKLGDVTDIFVGLQTSADDVFILDFVSETTHSITLATKALNQEWSFEKDLFHPLVSGTDIRSYSPLPRRQFILFPYEISENSAHLISLDNIRMRWPRTAEYLIANRGRLENREACRLKNTQKWHGYIYLKNMTRQGLPKLCVPRLVEVLTCSFDSKGTTYLDNVDVGGVVFNRQHGHLDLCYLLALLNSQLLRWFFPHVSAPFRGGFRSANRQFLSQLPIRILNLSDKADRKEYEAMVGMAKRVLAAKRKSAAADTLGLEREIDERVYRLYGLTQEEIALVEAAREESPKRSKA
jgi:adenine-specific DNA-methyltransferase